MPAMNETVAAIIANASEAQPYVIATPIPTPTPLPPGIVTTWMDWSPIPTTIPAFHVPLWAMFMILSLAAIVLVFVKWNDMSKILDPIKPWYIKAREIKVGKTQVLRITRIGNFIPDVMDIFDNVLGYDESEVNINQWRLRSPNGIIRIGGIAAPILSEDFDQNRDPVVEMAICHASDLLDMHLDEFREQLTDRYNELKRAKIYSGPNPADMIRPIHSYNDYIGKTTTSSTAINESSGHSLLQWVFQEGIAIDSYIPFNQSKPRQFWPGGNNTSAFLGGENNRIVEVDMMRPDTGQKSFLEQWGGLLVGIIMFLVAIIGIVVIPV